MMVLWLLILRGVSIELRGHSQYRQVMQDPLPCTILQRRERCDYCANSAFNISLNR
jgi:hypothetical protein